MRHTTGDAVLARDPLRFELLRNKDADVVAVGCQFADGTVVLRWIGDHPSTQVYSDWAHVMRIHHVGEPNSGDRWTTAVWLDGVCFSCGHSLHDMHMIHGGNGTQCGACSATWDGPPSRSVESGTWVSVGTLPAGEQYPAAPPVPIVTDRTDEWDERQDAKKRPAALPAADHNQWLATLEAEASMQSAVNRCTAERLSTVESAIGIGPGKLALPHLLSRLAALEQWRKEQEEKR